MKLVATLAAPLFVHTTKSETAKGKFILNLNNYRNAFPFICTQKARPCHSWLVFRYSPHFLRIQTLIMTRTRCFCTFPKKL